MIGAPGNIDEAPGHVVGAVAAAVFGCVLGNDWSEEAVEVAAVAAAHESGLYPLAFMGQVAGGKSNEQMRRRGYGMTVLV